MAHRDSVLGGRINLGLMAFASSSARTSAHFSTGPYGPHSRSDQEFINRAADTVAAGGHVSKRRRVARQNDRKRRSHSEAALQFDAPSVRLGDCTHGRQPEPAPTVTAAGVLTPREGVEDASLVGNRDAGAGVSHPDAHFGLAQRRPDHHGLLRPCVLHGVAREIHDGLRQAMAVGDESSLAAVVERPPAWANRVRFGGELLCEEPDVYRLRVKKIRVLCLREQLQVVDDPSHPVELAQDERDRPTPLLRFVPEQLEIPDADRDRVTQLVGYVVDKLRQTFFRIHAWQVSTGFIRLQSKPYESSLSGAQPIANTADRFDDVRAQLLTQ